MIKQALCFTLFAAVPVLCYGGQDSKPQSEPSAQEKPASQSPVVLSPKATIPSAGSPDGVTPQFDLGKTTSQPKPREVAPVDDKTYLIGVEDVLQIDVWEDPRLSKTYNVRPDGYISMLLIKEIKAEGKTPSQLRDDIVERLKAGEFLSNAEVNVSVQEVKSKRLFIQGEVKKPGAVSLVIPTKVLEALVNAGGFNDFADKKHIVIQRGAKRFKFNYNEVIEGKKPEQNIYLEPGDLIIVK